MKNIATKAREFKGSSLLKWVDDYVLVDIETTGLSPRTDEIIEIGAIKVKENKIIDKYDSLIRIDRSLNPFITNLTGITNEMLQKGKDSMQVLEEFMDFTGVTKRKRFYASIRRIYGLYWKKYYYRA